MKHEKSDAGFLPLLSCDAGRFELWVACAHADGGVDHTVTPFYPKYAGPSALGDRPRGHIAPPYAGSFASAGGTLVVQGR